MEGDEDYEVFKQWFGRYEVFGGWTIGGEERLAVNYFWHKKIKKKIEFFFMNF